MHELLTVEEMADADRRTIEAGTPGIELMRNAGEAVAHEVMLRWTPRSVAVLCGPGNNGGDGYVVAQILANAGWDVEVVVLDSQSRPKGDAGIAAGDWAGRITDARQSSFNETSLIIDALFGAGLDRDITGDAGALIETAGACNVPLVAIDVPSGIDGNTGQVRGIAAMADLTVTFCRAKRGHYLHPGKTYIGELVIRDIGIPDEVIASLTPSVRRNDPDLWFAEMLWPSETSHKYSRGGAYVFSGGPFTSGAARLASTAAMRIGAGVVTMISPGNAMQVNASALLEVMLRRLDEIDEIEAIADPRIGSVLVGPGAGSNEGTQNKILALLESFPSLVVDADGLSAFAGAPDKLFEKLRGTDILTPHEGEFRRLFGNIGQDTNKLEAVRVAAKRAGAVVMLKGDDSVVAHPDGQAVINVNGSPWLATAGSGDVLAGMITGLIAQEMTTFEAAQAAIFIHAEAGKRSGPGTIARDLVEALPAVLRELHEG